MAGVSLYGIMDWPFYLASWFWRLDERADRHLDALTKYIDGLAGQMDRVCATTCDKLENRCDELERKMDDIGDIGEGKIDELESDLETKMDEVESDLEGKVKEVAFDLGTKMDDTESGLGARVQEIEDDMDLRFDGLVDRLETWEKKINLHVEEQASYITQQLVQSGLEIGEALAKLLQYYKVQGSKEEGIQPDNAAEASSRSRSNRSTSGRPQLAFAVHRHPEKLHRAMAMELG
ncbi:MAG: hypothetical protein LQ346_008747, partial [Caloplaca aetnensis]